jgi:hypothetical protein
MDETEALLIVRSSYHVCLEDINEEMYFGLPKKN